jgi:hypothetical protein
MKKLIGFLVLLFLGISLLSSCTDEVIPDINNNSIEYLEKVASEIGKQHNQSLDFVFQELKNNGTIVTKNQMKQVLKTGIDKFSRTIERDQQILDLANEKANEEINKYFMGVELNKRLFVSTPIKGIVDQYDSLLSDLLRKKLLVSDAIVNQFNGVNGMDIVLELDRLKQAGKHELNYDDLFIFLTAIEVGKNSIQYWTENKQEWEMLLNASNNSRILKPFSWGEVAGVDVAGAVGAAVSTALLNAAPGAGQVAYGSAIVAGAAGASAADAVLQVWNNFWN